MRRKLGNRVGARADFKTFLERAPNHDDAPSVRKILEELEAGRD
jgi:hypothetical protein